jgi:membrane-bound metal-dependent hydrolase YbcI (DUF457 family)
VNLRAGVVTATYGWAASIPWLAETPREAVVGFLVAGLASAAPDLDHPGSTLGRLAPVRVRRLLTALLGGHRAGAHSLAAAAGIWWLAGWATDSPTLARAAVVGFLAHLFTDLLTPDGIAWLWPLGYLGKIRWLRFLAVLNRKTDVGWIRTGTKAEDRYVTVVRFAGRAVLISYVALFWPQLIAIGGFA